MMILNDPNLGSHGIFDADAAHSQIDDRELGAVTNYLKSDIFG